jgi:hypothetical protein
MLWNQLKMSQLLKENMINCSFLSEDFSYETGVETPVGLGLGYTEKTGESTSRYSALNRS